MHDLVDKHACDLLPRTRGAILDVVEGEVDFLIGVCAEGVCDPVHGTEDEKNGFDTA